MSLLVALLGDSLHLQPAQTSSNWEVIIGLATLAIVAFSAWAAFEAFRATRFTIFNDVQAGLTTPEARGGRFLARDFEGQAAILLHTPAHPINSWSGFESQWLQDLELSAARRQAATPSPAQYDEITHALGLFVSMKVLMDARMLDPRVMMRLWAPTLRRMDHYARTFVAHKRQMDGNEDSWEELLELLDLAGRKKVSLLRYRTSASYRQGKVNGDAGHRVTI